MLIYVQAYNKGNKKSISKSLHTTCFPTYLLHYNLIDLSLKSILTCAIEKKLRKKIQQKAVIKKLIFLIRFL